MKKRSPARFHTSLASLLLRGSAGFALVFALGACGDSGEGTPQVTISGDNLADVAVAAGSALELMSSVDQIPTPPGPIPGPAVAAEPLAQLPGDVTELSANLTAEAADAALTGILEPEAIAAETIDCDAGTIEVDLDVNGDGVIAYLDCEMASVIFNGAIRIRDTASSAFAFSTHIGFEDLCVDWVEDSLCIDGMGVAVTCDIDGDVSTCNYRFSHPGFAGLDGRIYSISGISLDGYFGTGWTVDGRCVDPDHGAFEFDTLEPVQFECANGAPSAGAIALHGAEGSQGDVTFDDCNSFTTCIGEDCTIHDWADWGLDPEPL